jgi:GH24 family phage-related lysozyme (muramidase)
MRLSECGARFVALFEGVRLKPYNDSSGYCTVGIGHLLHYSRCDGTERSLATEQEAYDLFRADMDGTYAKAVNSWANARGRLLLQHQFDCLCSFTFNLGTGIIGDPNSALRRALDSHGDVAEALKLYDKARNPRTGAIERVEGLTRRRKAEALLWDRSEYGFPCVPTRPKRKDDEVPQLCVQPRESVVMQFEELPGKITVASTDMAVDKSTGQPVDPKNANGAIIHLKVEGVHDETIWLPPDRVVGGWPLPGDKGGFVQVANLGPNVASVFINYDD